jgi:HEAT repeat protein
MGRQEYLESSFARSAVRRRRISRGNTCSKRRRRCGRRCLGATSKSAAVRAELADVLGLMKDESALPALQELKRDTHGEVARNAERAVRRITAGTTAGTQFD